MSMLIIIFWAGTLFSLTSAEETVRYAAVIYRHGDRTPVDTYPTDPWRNESLWPVKFGELTNTGKMQHYHLGQWLRQRYSHLLSVEFEPSEIYIRSTDVDRTLMSAQANLAGMYPPKGRYIWDSNLMWQPIPVHTIPEKQDEVLAMKKLCVAYNEEKEKFLNSKAFKERLKKYQKLMDYLSKYTGRKIKDYYDILDIYTTLYIETLYNFTLPNWTQTIYPDALQEPACYSFTTPAATPLLARLSAGPLLKEIVSKMTRAMSAQDSKALKVSIYSGHDLTVATVLSAMGMFDKKCPHYTATILMELIYDNSTASYFIRISYRNSVDIVEPQVLSIPYCDEKCPVERFMELYDNLITVNFDYECKKQSSGLLGILLFVGLGIMAAVYGIVHCISIYKLKRRMRGKERYISHSKEYFLPEEVPVFKAVLQECVCPVKISHLPHCLQYSDTSF